MISRLSYCHSPSPELHKPQFVGFPGSSVVKKMPANAGNPISIPGLGRSSGEGSGKPLPYSCLENSMDQRSLVAYSPCGHKESNMTKQLNSNNKLVRWESEFLSMEPMNGIHEYANTQSSKRIGFIKEEESTKLSTQTLRGGNLQQFLCPSLNHIISNQLI